MGFGLTRGALARFQETGRSGVWRLALSWTVLLAFALQSYVTQTHVHEVTVAQLSERATAVSMFASPQRGDPEAIGCPFCQAITAAGAFVGPNPAVLSFPALRTETADLPLFVIGLAIRAAGFSWRSRAPPQT